MVKFCSIFPRRLGARRRLIWYIDPDGKLKKYVSIAMVVRVLAHELWEQDLWITTPRIVHSDSESEGESEGESGQPQEGV